MNRSSSTCLTLALLALLPALVSSPARAQPGTPTDARARAEKLYAEAATSMQAQDYASACPKLVEAVQLVPDGIGAKLTLAECYQGEGRLASAWRMFLLTEHAAGKAGRTERQTSAHDRAEALKPKLAHLTIIVPDVVRKLPGIEVKFDEYRVSPSGVLMPVDTGQHTIVATATGTLPWKKTIEIKADGTSETVTIDGLTPAPPPRHRTLKPEREPPPPRGKPSVAIPYAEGDRILPGYYVESRIRSGLLIGGLATFTPFYSLTVAGVGIDDLTGNEVALFPVFGPFVAAITPRYDSSNHGVITEHFIITGIGQLTGAILAIVAVAAPKRVQIRGKAPAALTIVPAAGLGFAGMRLVGAL